MADASFQEVVFYGILHQVIIYGGFGDTLEVLDRFVVITLEGGEVRDLEIILVRQSVVKYPQLVSRFL